MSSGVEPLGGRARWAVIALIAVVVTDLVAIGSDLLEVDLMQDLIDGKDVSSSKLDADDYRQIGVGLVTLAVYVASIVFFIRWFHRAYSSLPALGAQLRFKTGWAIGGWFVPIMWFWRPKQIANDIWRGSDPSTRSLHITKTEVGGLMGVWWAAWIIDGFIFTRSAAAYADTPSATDAGISALLGDTSGAGDIRSSAILDAVGSCIDIVAAVLAIVVVRRLTLRFGERESMLASLPAPSEPATGLAG